MAPAPATAVELARRQFLAGQRVDMQALAADLGIGRTTLYRWVGDRDALLGATLGVIATRMSARCYASAGGCGSERIITAMRDFLMRVAKSQPFRVFLADEPQTALRVLMSPTSRVVEALAASLQTFVATERDGGSTVPQVDVEDAAWIIMQLAISFCWAGVVTGEEPDIERALSAVRVVLR